MQWYLSPLAVPHTCSTHAMTSMACLRASAASEARHADMLLCIPLPLQLLPEAWYLTLERAHAAFLIHRLHLAQGLLTSTVCLHLRRCTAMPDLGQSHTARLQEASGMASWNTWSASGCEVGSQQEHSTAQPASQGPTQQARPCNSAQLCQHQHQRHAARRASAGGGRLSTSWLVLALLSMGLGCRAVRLFRTEAKQPDTMRQWASLLETTESTAFEEAFEATYSGQGAGIATRTLDQYDMMVEWLVRSPSAASSNIQELHNYAVRELVHDAVQLADIWKAGASNPALNETKAVAVLEYISSRLSQLSSRYGYPVARRIIVGALLKQRVELGKFSKPVKSLVDKILLQLFQLHKKSTANKGAVQFFHISKSGGTNLCMAAEANGCNTQDFSERRNCLIKDFQDEPRWVSHQAHKYVAFRMLKTDDSKRVTNPWFVNFHSARKTQDSCEERREKLKLSNWTFYANEYTIPQGEESLCRQFVNLMMWREPLDRLQSQISWIQKLYKQEFSEKGDISLAFKDRTSSFWERLVPAGVNNYYIRSLLGERFFEYPVLAINQTHVQRAKVQVLLHDLLLTLDNKQFNDVTLKIGLGWSSGLTDSNIRSSSDIADEISMPKDYEKLQERNSPDVQVYDFVRELQSIDVLLFNFIAALDKQLGLKNLSSDRCGYVSLDGSADSKAK